MAPEEKAGLCSGRDFRNTKPMERPGVPGVMVSDGSHGLRKQAGEADRPGRNAARNGGAAGINRLQTKNWRPQKQICGRLLFCCKAVFIVFYERQPRVNCCKRFRPAGRCG